MSAYTAESRTDRQNGDKEMRKRLIALVAAVFLIGSVIAAGVKYSQSVSQTIYTESTTHLTEIYHQANRALHDMVERKCGAMHMWAPYIRDASTESQIKEYVENVKEEVGFTDFYFISREGNYRTAEGSTGYLDMKENLPKLIIDRQDVVVTSVVPGKPEIIVFAIPVTAGT